MTCYLRIVVIFGFVITQLRDKRTTTRDFLCHRSFLFFPFGYNVIQYKEEDDNNNVLLTHHHCFWLLQHSSIAKRTTTWNFSCCFFFVVPFNAKNMTTMMVCYLFIIIVFGFATTQFCNEEDGDVRFLTLSFFFGCNSN